MMYKISEIVCCLLLVILAACNQNTGKKGQPEQGVSSTEAVSHTEDKNNIQFPFPEIPAMLTDPMERRDFLLAHYWQRFDFSDTLLVDNAEITEQGWANYIALLTGEGITTGQIKGSLDNLCTRMEQHSHATDAFLKLADDYWYNANSPYYNELLYQAFLRRMMSSKFLDDARKSTLRFKAELIARNCPGEKATDFVYYLPDGSRRTLAGTPVSGNRLLLVFYDPECPSCHEVMKEMFSDSSLARAVSEGELTVLAVYTEDDMQAWERNLPDMPAGWSVGTDRQAIKTGALYDLKAMPSLYLLDAAGKVLLKDAPYPAIRQALGL